MLNTLWLLTLDATQPLYRGHLTLKEALTHWFTPVVDGFGRASQFDCSVKVNAVKTVVRHHKNSKVKTYAQKFVHYHYSIAWGTNLPSSFPPSLYFSLPLSPVQGHGVRLLIAQKKSTHTQTLGG